MKTSRTSVFISAAEILVPPAQGLSEFLQSLLTQQRPIAKSQTKISDKIFIESLELALDASDRHHPSIRDVKSMRIDVIAMCICLGRMLESFGESNWAEVPLFVSTGASASGLTAEIQGIYSLLREHISSDDNQRNQQVNHEIHPLFALKALTNSAQAYAAQIFGFRGQNTTFGSTSDASFQAFNEGFELIQLGEADRVVVAASNGGGFYSQLMGVGLAPQGRFFCESPCAVSMILESEGSLLQRNITPICEVFEIKSSSRLPQMDELDAEQIYAEFKEKAQAQAIFSGGSCFESLQAEIKSIAGHWPKSMSPYSILGGTGCVSVLLNIAVAYQMLREKLISEVDCLDVDTYFRASCIQLGRPKALVNL